MTLRTCCAPLLITLVMAAAACDEPRTVTIGLPVHGDFADDLGDRTPEVLNDETIAAEVRKRIAEDETLTIDAVDVVVERGAVRLTGSAPQLAARKRAAALAAGVRGVVAVDNDISLPRVEIDDLDIAREVEAQLAADPATSPFDLDVSSDDGVVSMRGKLASHAERLAALAAAERVEGVIDTDDRITVAATNPRSDEEIREDIVSLLDLEPEIEPAKVSVEVEDGQVTLFGRVPTLGDKLRLLSLVGVEGVVAVEHERLGVGRNATPALMPPGYALPPQARAQIR